MGIIQQREFNREKQAKQDLENAKALISFLQNAYTQEEQEEQEE